MLRVYKSVRIQMLLYWLTQLSYDVLPLSSPLEAINETVLEPRHGHLLQLSQSSS